MSLRARQLLRPRRSAAERQGGVAAVVLDRRVRLGHPKDDPNRRHISRLFPAAPAPPPQAAPSAPPSHRRDLQRGRYEAVVLLDQHQLLIGRQRHDVDRSRWSPAPRSRVPLRVRATGSGPAGRGRCRSRRRLRMTSVLGCMRAASLARLGWLARTSQHLSLGVGSDTSYRPTTRRA